MAESSQPNLGNVALAVQAGYQQFGQEMFVTILFSIGTMNFQVSLPVAAAKHTSKIIKDAAESAEVQVIKPPSMIVPN